MRPLLLLPLLFLTSVARAADDQSFDTLLAKTLPTAVHGEHLIDYPQILLLKSASPETRNQIAAAAARELSLKTPAGDSITADFIDNTIHHHPKLDTPAQAAVRRLHDHNFRLVTFLRDMESEHLLSTPDVIPPLIDMLDYPGNNTDIRDSAAQTLYQLTGRMYDQNENLLDDRDQKPNPNHPKFVAWWRNWWKQNKDNHPVMDSGLEKQILTRVAAIETHLRKSLPDQDELSYLNPQFLRISRSNAAIVAEASVDTSVVSSMHTRPSPDGPRAAKPSDYIYLQIIAQFATPAFIPEQSETRPAPTSHSRITAPKKEYLHELLPHTDILITVTAASQDESFLKQLQSTLSKLPLLK